MWKRGTIGISISLLLLLSCQPKSDYQKLVDSELSTGVVYDSLFAGLSFSMSKQEFFDYCWEMNSKGIFTNGTGSQVLLDVSNDFSRTTGLSFYPKYVNGEMLEMPMEFRYQDWAPWNESTKVELLIEELKVVMLEWYGGNEFMEIQSEDNAIRIWVKVDGNRQISIGRKNISTALVKITDLALSKALEPNSKS